MIEDAAPPLALAANLLENVVNTPELAAAEGSLPLLAATIAEACAGGSALTKMQSTSELSSLRASAAAMFEADLRKRLGGGMPECWN